MSTRMSQVTCSLCDKKIDDLKKQSHKVSTNHLQKGGKIDNELTTKVFKMIFDF